MIDADIITRSHFTRKYDGKTSFETWKMKIGLQSENLPFEYESKGMVTSTVFLFIVESWGGFVNASGEWTIFISWRCAKSKVVQYIHWTWDARSKKCINRRDYSFTG